MNFFQRLRRKSRKERFSAWQIEITTRCPLRCEMCIKKEHKDWFRKDMDIEDFKRIAPYLRNVENVVLEGWGESLLHEQLIEFIKLAKQEGPEVGFVTSGVGLSRKFISGLIDAGLDFVGFSLSGATSKTHNSIRIGSDFNELINAIRLFRKVSIERDVKKPRMHLVYLMLKDNIHEVPLLTDLAKEIGIDEIVLLNIIHVTNAWQDAQKVFTCNNKEPYQEIMREAELKAQRSRIRLRKPFLSSHDVAVCSENPLENIYVSVDGEVSPCVYLNPPIPSPFKRIFCGVEYDTERVSFGNMFKESFETIWSRKEFLEFRNRFIFRRRRLEETYASLLDMKRMEEVSLPEPPSSCRTCHKMLGV